MKLVKVKRGVWRIERPDLRISVLIFADTFEDAVERMRLFAGVFAKEELTESAMPGVC
jgi:hypothetical protein